MQITHFRIQNFRSLIDSRWVKFSADGVTALVGQNESGKTSILEALSKTFSDLNISNDDVRVGADLPIIEIRVTLEFSELEIPLSKYPPAQIEAVKKKLADNNNTLEISSYWTTNAKIKGGYGHWFEIFDTDFEGELAAAAPIEEIEATLPAPPSSENSPAAVPPETAEQKAAREEIEKYKNLKIDVLEEIIWNLAPRVTLFQAETGLLPNTVEIGENDTLVGPGAAAAQNFLDVAKISISTLKSDLRTRSVLLKKANERISKDFSSFWSQTIGNKSKLQLQCSLEIYGQDAGSKAGKPYLAFFISDGMNALYPKQRSQGVRWFISFYLQLKASELKADKHIFLLDEPGANLHSKAQGDVLKLINKLSKDIMIVYSTHSAHMIEYSKFYRVLAVQRTDEHEDSPTEVIDAHRLGTASSDTLSPILTVMGIDLSHQQVIKKDNNVLLEEMSGFYYLSSFWKLKKEPQTAHFIAATGVGKVEMLANMFRGWGLDFVIAIDDDNNGRLAYGKIKKELYGDNEELAKQNMVRFKDCIGIEDVFSKNDFKKFILEDERAEILTTNSDYFKIGHASKPVLAYQFAMKVDNGKIKLKLFDTETQSRITQVVESISKRLNAKNAL